MKKLVIMMLSIALVSGVSAQRHGGGYRVISPSYYVRPSVGIGYGYGYGLGLGYGYGLYGYPYFGYPFYGFPPTYNYGASRQSKLNRQIDEIKSDYADKIYSARNATDLDGKQRRAEVRRLKQERDETINNLRNNYYKTPVQTPSQNYNNNNSNNPNNSTPKVQE